ncbi:MAG: hypothetical protein M8467_20220, partial [Anaerolineae bacterium]|nr:hypothetical protein [Anaerolineae bacterium]
MTRVVRSGQILLVLCALLLWVLPAHAAPALTLVNSQVTVLQDGRLQVRYQLTFVDDGRRTQITNIGPFDPGHSQIAADLEHAGQVTEAKMVALGGDSYRAEFAIETTPGETYTLEVRYLLERYLDTTTIDGVPYRVLAWSPPQWSLPIEEEVATFILPIELSSDITQPEQVTQEVVDNAGIFVTEDVLQSFDRWVYYPTPDETTGQVWLSLFVSEDGVPANGRFLVSGVYLPARYFSATTTPEPLPAVPPAQVTPGLPTQQPATPERKSPIALLIGLALGGGLVLAGGIVYGTMRWVAPKAAPEGYEAPEIEIETFEQPGLVPDLEAIEAALYIGDTAKVLTL